jgi:hypothetical protein
LFPLFARHRLVAEGVIAGRIDHIFIVIAAILIEIIIPIFGATEAALLLFLTKAVVGQHTEIVIGELQIIFRVHPVARKLRVARKVTVLFE